MDLIAVWIVLLLDIGFFLMFGWYSYVVCKLWGTSEYGGTLYTSSILKALAAGMMLVLSMYVAKMYEIPSETTKNVIAVSAPFFLAGWLFHIWHQRRRNRPRGLRD